jgi:hypothetical protein
VAGIQHFGVEISNPEPLTVLKGDRTRAIAGNPVKLNTGRNIF